MMLPSLRSRLVVLATIFVMVFVQTFIFMMSETREQTESQETTSTAVTNLVLGVDNYPFLTNPQTIKYISTQIKVMIFLHVASDKEMSALAKAIANTYKDSATCCLNNYRDSDVNPLEKIVYQKCQDQIENSCEKGLQVIIVNGTDKVQSDLQDYFILAHRYNYTTLVVQPNATSRHRGAHNSLSEPIQDTLTTTNETPNIPTILYPFFYGWFLGFNISLDTLRFGKTIFKECLQQPKFVEIFKKYAIPGSPRNSSGGLDFDHYFSLEGLITGTTLLHCTSFFSNYSERAGSWQYANSSVVRQANGRAFNLTIIGFLITPRTFGARFRLDNQELLLWKTNSSTLKDFTPVGAASSVDKTVQQKQLDQSKHSQENLTFDLVKDTEVPCPKGWRPTTFSPTCGQGSRAHLSLGTGKGIEAVQTGLDLNAIIRKELEAVAKKEDILTLKLKSGTVRCYGKGNWAVYLDKPLEVCTLFTGWY